MSLCMCDGRYSLRLLYDACRYKVHLWKPWRSVCSYVVLGHVCCYGCYASQERINMCTVPTVPWLCCHPLSSWLTYSGSHKQCPQWYTARQLVSWIGSTRCLLCIFYCILLSGVWAQLSRVSQTHQPGCVSQGDSWDDREGKTFHAPLRLLVELVFLAVLKMIVYFAAGCQL